MSVTNYNNYLLFYSQYTLRTTGHLPVCTKFLVYWKVIIMCPPLSFVFYIRQTIFSSFACIF